MNIKITRGSITSPRWSWEVLKKTPGRIKSFPILIGVASLFQDSHASLFQDSEDEIWRSTVRVSLFQD